MSIDVKFKCRRVNVPDLVGASVVRETLLFNLIRLNSEKKYPTLVFDEKKQEFRFKRLEIPEAIHRDDYIGMFVGFQSRNTYFACFMPVKDVIEQLVEAEDDLELEEVYCKFNDNWTLIWNKGQFVNQQVFDLKDGDISFVPLKGDHLRTVALED